MSSLVIFKKLIKTENSCYVNLASILKANKNKRENSHPNKIIIICCAGVVCGALESRYKYKNSPATPHCAGNNVTTAWTNSVTWKDGTRVNTQTIA